MASTRANSDTDTDTDDDEENIIHPSKKRYEDEATDKKWNFIFSTAISLRAKSEQRRRIIIEKYQREEKSWESLRRTRFNEMQMMYIKNHHKKQMEAEDDIQAYTREIITKMHRARNK